jgi:acyl-CoA thioesterase
VDGVSGEAAARVPEGLRTRIESEPWAHALGVEYLELRPGYCRVALTLGPEMRNFQGYPHGGVIFSLADVAFGAACNSHGQTSVALTMTISYLAAVRPEARLVAECAERKRGGRTGFYEVAVSTADEGMVVARVECVSHQVEPGTARGGQSRCASA